jgi:serpin B
MFLSRLFSPQAGPDAASANHTSIADCINQLALNVYQNLCTTEGNLFFSPYCIFTPLALISAGARGITAAEMGRVLQASEAGDRWHAQVAECGNLVMAGRQKGEYELHVANRLWAQRGFALLPTFLSLMAEHYDASVQDLDFVQNRDTARALINEWVEAQTAGRIKELLSDDIINENTRAILTTAIYFHGLWLSLFKPNLTYYRDFWVSPSQKLSTAMMSQTSEFSYARHDEAQVIELPYRGLATNGGADLSMFILLPNRVDGLDMMGHRLTLDKLETWLNNLKQEEVTLLLPRFRILSTCSLKRTLAKMGMPSAFTADTADFSGMVEIRPPDRVWIQEVLHKAYINVDEQGTEAAAATAILFGFFTGDSAHREVFLVDRPFIFLIRHNPSRSILFMGHVRNPTV